MSKSVLVIDTPESCDKCPFCDCGDYTCGAFQIIGSRFTYEVPEDGNPIPDWCPLKPLPEKKEEMGLPRIPSMGDFEKRGFQNGWNACIDAITGGKL